MQNLFCAYYDVSEKGNWEEKNILNVPTEPSIFAKTASISEEELENILAEGRQQLMAATGQQEAPPAG